MTPELAQKVAALQKELDHIGWLLNLVKNAEQLAVSSIELKYTGCKVGSHFGLPSVIIPFDGEDEISIFQPAWKVLKTNLEKAFAKKRAEIEKL